MIFPELVGVGLAKYAPLVFLTTNQKGELQLNVAQVVQTLLVAGIVAGVTMYGTVQVLRTELDHLRKDVTKIAAMSEEAIRVQREIVPMRNLQVKTLQDDVAQIEARLRTLEKRR